MSSSLEYHIFVPLFRNASFSLFLLPVFFVSGVCAQVNGAPPTSTVIPPLVGRSVNPPTGAPSVGPRGFAPGPGSFVPFSRSPMFPSNANRTGERRPHHHHDQEFAPPFFYTVPVPYVVDSSPADDSASGDDDEYQGGPTIFDRRGSGFDSYVPPVRDVPTPHAAANAAAPADSDPPPIPTVLVFRSGRQLEVGNYAIVGATLFDLTPGHTRKIALADLDLEATRQQNDDRGVAFQLPAPQGN